MTLKGGYGMGWIRDLPDTNDYTEKSKKVEDFFEKKKILSSPLSNSNSILIPESDFSPIENQDSLGSCTANAGIGLMEYYQNKTKGKYIDMSRLFLYKAARNLLNWKGDTGAYLRTTMQAMVLFGCPPENYWPYKISDFDVEPPAFLYSFAKEFQTVRYIRVDPPRISGDQLLDRIKSFINRKMPMMFGFTVYNSISQSNSNGGIPYPCSIDRRAGGHAVVAMGFDDSKEITNTSCGDKTTGAIKIRNSWGTGWGDNGYGWLPYKYIQSGLAVDWWTIVRNEWVNLDVFD